MKKESKRLLKSIFAATLVAALGFGMVPYQPIAQVFDTGIVANAQEETVTTWDGREIPMSDVLVVNNGVYFDNLRYATIYAQDGDLDNISSAFAGDELKFTYKDSEGEEEVKKVFWTVNGVPVFDTDKFEALKKKYFGMVDSVPNGQLTVVEGKIPDLDAVTATDDESSTSVDDSFGLNVPEIIGEIFDTFHTDKELTLTMGEEPLNVCSYAAYDVKLFMNDSGEWLNLILPENLTTPGYGELTRYTDGEWFVNGNIVTNTIDEGEFEAAKDEVMSSFGPFAYNFLERLKFVVDLVEPDSVVSVVLEVLMNHLDETGSAIGPIGGDPVIEKKIDYPYGNLTIFVPEGQVINFVPEGQVINVVPKGKIINVRPGIPEGMDIYELLELFGGVNVAEPSVDEKVDLYIDLIKYVLKSIERAYGDNILDAITNHGKPIFDDYCVYADADKGTKTLMFTVLGEAKVQWKNRYTVLGEKKFEGDEVVVNAPEGAESGAWFVNGKRIDTLETVENYVVGENNALTITVCEPVESVEWKEFAGNSMVMSSRKKVGNYIKVNLTAKWALPEGAEVVEAGIARVYAEDCPEDFDAQYIYDNGSKKVSSLKTLNGKYSYALSMNSKSAKKTLCAVSFVTYKIGDVTYTDLSDIAVSAEPAADLA